MTQYINFGGELKSLGDGRFGGYLATFSDAGSPDLEGDFFTKRTEFFQEDGAKLPILYEHGLDPVLKRRKIGVGTIKTDEVGVWIDIQLQKRDRYEKAIASLAAKGKMGLSSGAANHLVSKEKVKGANFISEWGLAEGSLTVTPMEPRNGVMPLKSYEEEVFAKTHNESFKSLLDDFWEDDDDESFTPTAKSLPADKSLSARLTRLIDDLVEEGQLKSVIVKKLALEALCDESDIEDILTGKTSRPPNIHLKACARVLNVSLDQLTEIAGAPSKQTIKGMFADKMAEKVPNRWDLDSVLCCTTKDVATIAKASAATGTEFDRKAKVKEIVSEHAIALESLINLQIDSYLEQGSDEPFYLKSVSDLSSVFENIEGVAFSEHSQLVVSAFKGISKRFDRYYQNRLKAGRVLSESTRKELIAFNEQILTAASGLQALLEKTQPMATSTEKNAALSEFMRLDDRLNQLGV